MARKFLAALGSAALLLWTAAALAQGARSANMFKDLDQNHWAYQAVEVLRTHSVVTGYPEGYFRGKRPLTRYEFAIAIDRALRNAANPADRSSITSLDSPLDSRDVDTLRRLSKEFREELASLGLDESAATKVLDDISRRVAGAGGINKPPFGANATADNSDTTSPAYRLSAGNPNPQGGFTLHLPLGNSSRSPRITLGSLSQSFDSKNLDRRADSADRYNLLLPARRPLDGANVSTQVGTLGLQAYYGRLGSPNLYDPATVAALDGSFGGPAGFSLSNSLDGTGTNPNLGLQFARAVGVAGSVGFHLFDRSGRLRLSASTISGQPLSAASTAEDLTVLGADSDIQLAKRLTLSAEWARSMGGAGRWPTGSPTDSDAFNAMIAYNGTGLNLSAGYRYVDPLFSTSGYWGRIGNWLNPTNIQGPTFRASYDLSPNVGLTLGGDYFTAARDSAPLGLDANEDIKRALLGVRWGLSRSLNLTADYEGVFWSLNGSRGAGTGMFHPTEHYITLGTGYNLTGSTLLRFNYQIGDFDGHGALSNGAGTRNKYNTFVGQVSVKF